MKERLKSLQMTNERQAGQNNARPVKNEKSRRLYEDIMDIPWLR